MSESVGSENMREAGRQTERQTAQERDKRKKRGKTSKKGKRGTRGKKASCVWQALLRGACVAQQVGERHLVTGDHAAVSSADAGCCRRAGTNKTVLKSFVNLLWVSFISLG